MVYNAGMIIVRGTRPMVLKHLAFIKKWRPVLFLVVFMLTAFVHAGPVHATSAAPMSPCDPLLMDAMEQRAWLEAQREIAQNQNIIVKPDSVLEYTCFDRFLGHLAGTETSGWLFSEIACCGITPQYNILNNVLGYGVAYAMENYIKLNFGHTFMGGKTAVDYPALPATADDIYQPANPNPIYGGAYNCDRMAAVWEAARCADFYDNTSVQDAAGNARAGPSNGFFDFPYFVDWDPRQIIYNPLGAGGGTPLNCRSPITQDAMNVAFNNRTPFYTLSPENTGAGPYPEDNISSNFARILPGGCSNPIPTGIMVTRFGPGAPAPYPDAFCPNPGCYYQVGGGGGLGTCVP